MQRNSSSAPLSSLVRFATLRLWTIKTLDFGARRIARFTCWLMPSGASFLQSAWRISEYPEYQTVRREEGRGGEICRFLSVTPVPGYIGPLPAGLANQGLGVSRPFFGRYSNQKNRFQGRLRILDLGAGNGWLSNRLAQRGHSLLAVDLLTNPEDGLGAFTNYETLFTPVQAEYDRLPLGPIRLI